MKSTPGIKGNEGNYRLNSVKIYQKAHPNGQNVYLTHCEMLEDENENRAIHKANEMLQTYPEARALIDSKQILLGYFGIDLYGTLSLVDTVI